MFRLRGASLPTSVNCFLPKSAFGFIFGSLRYLHTTRPRFNNSHHKTRLELLCELNKTLYIHRNSDLSSRPVFYRGPGKMYKVDVYQRYLEKQEALRRWRTYSRQIQTGESPVDDVYLASLYKTKEYGVGEAVALLRENTQLDFTDQQSPIHLALGLDELTRKVRKKKRPVSFFTTLPLPHPSGRRNKVCLFTGDEAISAAAQKMGVEATGTSDMIIKILNGKLVCDAFFATADSLDEVANHSDLKRQLGNHLPTRRFHLITDPHELHPYVHDVIVHNHVELTRCDVVVGVPEQSCSELEENIRQVFETIHKVALDNRAEKIINSASLSCFTEPIPIDPGDILPDDV